MIPYMLRPRRPSGCFAAFAWIVLLVLISGWCLIASLFLMYGGRS